MTNLNLSNDPGSNSKRPRYLLTARQLEGPVRAPRAAHAPRRAPSPSHHDCTELRLELRLDAPGRRRRSFPPSPVRRHGTAACHRFKVVPAAAPPPTPAPFAVRARRRCAAAARRAGARPGQLPPVRAAPADFTCPSLSHRCRQSRCTAAGPTRGFRRKSAHPAVAPDGTAGKAL